MKQEISVEKAIRDLREIFGLNKETKSLQDDNWFMIIKTEFERYDVISKLQEYFSDGASYETVISADKTVPVLPMKDVSEMGFDYGDKVVVQIKKK